MKLITFTRQMGLDKSTANGIKNHSSEAGLSNKRIDFHVSNDDTIEEFKEKLSNIFEQIVAQNNQRRK